MFSSPNALDGIIRPLSLSDPIDNHRYTCHPPVVTTWFNSGHQFDAPTLWFLFLLVVAILVVADIVVVAIVIPTTTPRNRGNFPIVKNRDRHKSPRQTSWHEYQRMPNHFICSRITAVLHL